MPSIEKRLNNAAVIKGATWGTAAQAGAASLGISPTNHGAIKLNMPVMECDEITNANETGIDFANVNAADFTLDFNHNYDGRENLLLAALIGADSEVQQGATTAWLHTMAMADSASGIFVTYAVDKNDKVYVVPSAKVTKASFSMNNGFIKSVFSLRGDEVTDADAVVTSLTTVTYPQTCSNRLKCSGAVFRINAQGGDALDADDVVSPGQFTLDIERKMDSVHAAGSANIIEPRENDKPTVKLTMEFPRMDATNEVWLASWKAKTEYKADLTITGPLISGSYYYYLKFEFPRLIIEDFDVPEAGLLGVKVTFRAVVAAAAPTGMTGLTKPVTVNLMNTLATGYLD
jgi:hypothetical protein